MSTQQSISTVSTQETAPPKFKRNMLLAARGSGIVASGKFFAYGSRFILAFLLARALGAEQYGLYTLAISAATIVAHIAAFGMDATLVRYVSINSSKKDEARLWGAIQFGLGTSMLLGVLLSTALFALAYFIADRIFHQPDLAPLLKLLALLIPFMTMSTVLAGATRGFKKMEYSVIAQDVVKLLFRLVLTAALFLSGLDPIQAVLIFGLADLVTSFLLLHFLNKEFRLKRPVRAARHDPKEMLGFSVPLWVSGLLKTFRSQIQTLLLGTMATVTSVGVFALVNNLNLVGRISMGSITVSSRPIIAELHAQKDFHQLGSLYQTTARWAFTVNLPIFIAMVLFRDEILAVFGQSFAGGATALIILAVAELVNVSTGICGSIIDMTGHTRLKLFNSIAQVGTIIGLNLLLIPRWGFLGAAIATLAGIALINFLRLFEVWFLFRLHPYSLSLVKPILAGLTGFVVALAVNYWINGNANIVTLIAQIAILFVVYVAVVLLLGLPEEERAVLNRLQLRTKIPFLRNQS